MGTFSPLPFGGFPLSPFFPISPLFPFFSGAAVATATAAKEKIASRVDFFPFTLWWICPFSPFFPLSPFPPSFPLFSRPKLKNRRSCSHSYSCKVNDREPCRLFPLYPLVDFPLFSLFSFPPNAAADIVQLGLGQSLTRKSLSTTTTTHHPPPTT